MKTFSVVYKTVGVDKRKNKSKKSPEKILNMIEEIFGEDYPGDLLMDLNDAYIRDKSSTHKIIPAEALLDWMILKSLNR